MKKFNAEDIEQRVVTNFFGEKITIYYEFINDKFGLFVSINKGEIDYCGRFKNEIFNSIGKKIRNKISSGYIYNNPKYKWEKLYLIEMIDYITYSNKTSYRYAEDFKKKLLEDNLKITCRFDWIRK